MAFSIKATLVIPLCLATITGSAIAADALEKAAREQAVAAVAVSRTQADARHLYQVAPVCPEPGGPVVLTLESSPQKVLVICRLIEDQAGQVKRWMTGSQAATP